MAVCFDSKLKKALSKAYLKKSVDKAALERFRDALVHLYDGLNLTESEEHIKIQMADFLKATFYGPRFLVNTKHKTDLAITDTGKTKVLFEVKHPNNQSEMVSAEKPYAKALYQLLLYFLRERVSGNNLELKHLVVTNVDEWYVFDAKEFEELATKDKQLVRTFREFETKGLLFSDTADFYSQVAKPWFEALTDDLTGMTFSLRDLARAAAEAPDNLEPLLPIYKFLSPAHLLRESFQNDSNALDKNFYNELLYWMGLEETREGSKSVIRRPAQPVAGSFTELILDRLDLDSRGVMPGDRWEVALELALLWVNRLIFLKLLESQLLNYHNRDYHYRFLGPNDIWDFGDLYNLFFGVLAVRRENRSPQNINRWARVPYMNSRLFELSSRENEVFSINQLDNNVRLTPPAKTVLKNPDGSRDGSPRKTLDYLLSFLDAYDFSSEGTGEIQDVGKALINASVLGLIFEKINGYKEGSFFTPGYITQYMARQSIHAAILTQFKRTKGWDCANLTELYNHIGPDDLVEANKIINGLKIVDPAVGSGHFLVSVLNELIAAKSELGILMDEDGRRLRDYKVVVENDELFVDDGEGQFVTYRAPFNYSERQRVWKTLFHEKQTLIERCLFGVDINPNSVQICKLRLWIELLKHAYYTSDSGYQDLETLPNLDIKIREGNSLVSRYPLDVSLSRISSREPGLLTEFPKLVSAYQTTRDKTAKNEIEAHIEGIKDKIRADLEESRPLRRQREVVKDKLDALNHEDLFGLSELEKKVRDKARLPLEAQLAKIDTQLDDEARNPIYRNSFEWRFEFPEVLDPVTGDFVGFDVVIGNPPYIYRKSDNDRYKQYYLRTYFNNAGNFDLYKYFLERGMMLLGHAGIQCLITNASFILQTTFEKTRELLLGNAIELLAPLGPGVFDEATVDVAILGVSKFDPVGNKVAVVVPDVPKRIGTTKPYYVEQSRFYNNTSYVFDYKVSDRLEPIVAKILRLPVTVQDRFSVGVGINTGYIKKELTASTKLDHRYHPMVPGTGISRYGTVQSDGFIMYDHNFVRSHGDRGRTLPAAEFFESEKLLVVRTRNLSLDQRIVATLDTSQTYNLNRLSNIISNGSSSLTVLLAILNSRLMNWLFTIRFFDYEIKPIYLCQLPLPADIFPEPSASPRKLSSSPVPKAAQIESLVTRILAAKKAYPAADTQTLEAEIDQLVYRLYGLTEDEIRIVEGEPQTSADSAPA